MSKKDLRTIDRDKCRAKSENQLRAVYDLCLYKSDLLRAKGDSDDALEEITEALSLCDQIPDSELDRALAYRKMGECLVDLQRYDDAKRHLKQYLDIAKSADSVLEQQRAWATLARCYFVHLQDGMSATGSKATELRRKALNANLRSLQLVEKLTDAVSERERAEMTGRIFLNLALLRESDEDEAAMESYQKALYIFTKHKLHEDLCRCLNSLSNAHLRMGNDTEALVIAGRLLDLGRQLKRPDVKCDAQFLRGAALIHTGDWEAARSAFKRAHRQKLPAEEDRARARRYLKLSCVLRECELKLRDEADPAKRSEVFEKLGDVLSKCGLYRPALKQYVNAADEATRAGASNRKMGELYASLAETCKDVGDFDSALTYYQKELTYRDDDPKEAALTHLNVARVLLKKGKKGEQVDVRRALVQAVELSRKAGKPSLELECLEELGNIEGGIRDPELGSRLRELQSRNIDTQTSGSDGESDLSDVQLDDISDTDESDPEFQDTVRRPCKRVEDKRNNKGESPLHRACIEGKPDRVQNLLKMGHSVNVRDHAGWQPLHEAANHGYLKIVQMLVEAGAKVNDPGGAECSRLTPLHDAAGNGHAEVILYLLERGANAAAKSIHGKTPLDCLREWISENSSELDDSARRRVEEAKLRLKERCSNCEESTSSVTPSCSVFRTDTSGRAEDDRPTKKSDSEPKQPSGWVYEEDYVWLEDDLAKPAAKPRHLAQTTLPVTRKKRSRSSSHFPQPKYTKSMRYNKDDDVGIVVPSEDHSQGNSDHEEDSRSHSPLERSAMVQPQPSMIPASSSLRVRIEDKPFFIPIPLGMAAKKTIQWLATEAAERYLHLVGVKPVLRLTLSDGALLGPSDTLDCLFHLPSTEIVGEVDSWDMPALPDRYVGECNRKGVPPCSNLLPVLRDCEARRDFSLRFSNGVRHLDLVFRALRHQPLLGTFDISGTALSPTSVLALAACLPTLESLNCLVLQCTCLVPDYVKILSDALQRSKSKLALTKLDLSYNPIGRDGMSPLAQLLSDCPKLKILRLDACKIADPGLVLQGVSTLERLYVSHNPLDRAGLESLAAVFGSNRLKVLDVANSFPAVGSGLGRLVGGVFSRPDCCLTEARLSCCNLVDDDLEYLFCVPSGTLTKLDLTGNPGLTYAAVNELSSKLVNVRIAADSCK
ncbi:putative tpr and ank domain-containing protein [Ixodes scapularis]